MHRRKIKLFLLTWSLFLGSTAAVAEANETRDDPLSFIDRSFINTTYALQDDASGARERHFSADGEIDLSLAYERMQFSLDVDITDSTDNRDSGVIEQAFVMFSVLPSLSLGGGVFNNPLGWEKEDVVDRDAVSHGQIWSLMDGQTNLAGNNVKGITLQGELAHTSFHVNVLNDIGDTPDKHSVEVVLNTEPLNRLNLEAGFITQAQLDDNPASAETLFDINGSWQGESAGVAAEYFTGDKLIDNAFAVHGRYRLGPFLAAVRWDSVSYLIANVDNTTSLTVTGAFTVNDTVKLAVEYRRNDNPTTIPVILDLPADGDSLKFQALMTL